MNYVEIRFVAKHALLFFKELINCRNDCWQSSNLTRSYKELTIISFELEFIGNYFNLY